MTRSRKHLKTKRFDLYWVGFAPQWRKLDVLKIGKTRLYRLGPIRLFHYSKTAQSLNK